MAADRSAESCERCMQMRVTSSAARAPIRLVEPGVRHLDTGEVVTLRAGPERVVEVLEGRVWLTVQHALEDAFPSAGESVAVPRRRLLVIEALAPTRVRVRSRNTLGERIGRAWTDLRMAVRARMARLAAS
jgi:hypothetical protein